LCWPDFIYFSNYIGSDNLFMSLSLCWFSQLIWILQRSARWQVVSQAVTYFVLFTICYNAMIYPRRCRRRYYFVRTAGYAQKEQRIVEAILANKADM